MPFATQKRRRAVEGDEESEEEVAQSTQRGRRHAPVSDESDEEDVDEEGREEVDLDGDGDNQNQVVKKLVRYALACEYQRLPIKRTGIAEKVFNKRRVPFKRVFDAAQQQLKNKFGMQMVALPEKEKITIKEKQKALKSKTNSKAVTSYILTTILPADYRIPEIMAPSIVGSSKEESEYIAICTVIVSIVALNPEGQVPDHKLIRYLRRMNADENMPMDKTAAVLAKMQKQGYIIKVINRTPDEETIDWRVGPRGKVEIGNRGIQGLVREVYGDTAAEDLNKRIYRSLGMEVRSNEREEEVEEEVPEGNANARRSGRRRRAEDDEE